MKLDIFMSQSDAVTYQNSVLIKTCCFFDVFNVVVIFIAKAP